MRRLLIGLLASALVATACGDDDDSGTPAGTTTSTTEAPTSTTGGSTGSSTTAASGELPGERIEIFPYEGAVLAVVGVDADDQLNVRDAPGATARLVAELDPLADDIAASGHNRRLEGKSVWAAITVDGVTGWANTEYLAQLGSVDDITAELYPDPADRPAALSLLDLAKPVASKRAGDEEPIPRIVVVAAPTVGDVGEITVDVLGYPDDAQLGERLHVFAEPAESGDGFTVRTVESTTLCRRGVSDGRCV